MPFPWLAAATAGGALASFIGGERRNSAQIDQSAKQMAFQERMSNTAHQRQMADLRQAGLNPMLSAKLGGASTPAGAQAQIQDTVTPAVNTAMQVAMNKAQLDQVKAQTNLTNAQTNALSIVSTVGEEASGLWEYVKQVGPKTEEALQEAIDTYMAKYSDIQSGFDQYKNSSFHNAPTGASTGKGNAPKKKPLIIEIRGDSTTMDQ